MNKEQRITAIEKSIKHWKDDIIKPLKKGRIIDARLKWIYIGERVPCFDADCPLCKLYYNKDDYRCYGCPLKSCGRSSTWIKFYHNPGIKTAQAMVNRLKRTLIMENKKEIDK
jgi:hypothetical protein